MGHIFSKLGVWVLLDGDWEKLKVWMVKKRIEGIAVMDICVQARVDRKTFLSLVEPLPTAWVEWVTGKTQRSSLWTANKDQSND